MNIKLYYYRTMNTLCKKGWRLNSKLARLFGKAAQHYYWKAYYSCNCSMGDD